MKKSYHNWLDSMDWQLDFYQKSFGKNRVDNETDWVWLNSQKGWKEKLTLFAGSVANLFRVPHKRRWFDENSKLLWNSREILCDQLSKLLFDCHLLLSVAGYNKYYYPRIDYDDFITVESEKDFISDLPKSYIGLPLKIYDIKLDGEHFSQRIKIVSTKSQIDLLNGYRQYFIKRGDIDFSPSKGQVVFDCGACIGDISLIFASLVGKSGEVHLFDPVPLHNRYCHLNAALNPRLNHTLHINDLAVSNISREFTGETQDVVKISPSGCMVDNFKTTSLDDYVSKNNIRRVDYIKMDIEKSEVPALRGASVILRKFKPRLAISAYHKPDDLWKIPALILKVNPKYKIYFGHHSPMGSESVYYAK